MTPRGTRGFTDDFREIAGGGGFGGSFFDRFFFDFFCLNNYKSKIFKKTLTFGCTSIGRSVKDCCLLILW